ncbi:2-hydroxyacyl-CoA dehydratase [Thermodesulfobacteriota bacterium]
MNFYDEYAAKLQRRIQKIEADTNPLRLKSNKIFYELELDLAKERAEAWSQGKPFCDGTGISPALAKAMGFTSTGSVESAFATKRPQNYLDEARTLGLPVETSCDMSMMPFAMMQCGDMPMVDLNVFECGPCTPMKMRSIYVAHKTKRFSYPMDIGREPDEANFQFILDQIYGFIEFAEKKFPGVIKYDEDKFIELQSYDKEAWAINQEIREMLKHKPSPIAGKDALRSRVVPTEIMTPRWVEFMRARRDEVAERIEKGLAGVPGEKLRVFWTMTNPVFMDVWKVLAKWKIAGFQSLLSSGSFTAQLDTPDFLRNRKLNPLEELAARILRRRGMHTGGRYIDRVISDCREFHIDGIVHYNMLGCQIVLPIKKMIEDQAEKEMGIPTLQLEGKQWDNNYANEETITAKLDDFAQMLLNQKGLA